MPPRPSSPRTMFATTRILRGDSRIVSKCACHRVAPWFCLLAAGRSRGRAPWDLAAALRSPEWPWNVRVGENSPSLWPTMFSVTNTGMNFRPLCTANVRPTMSGMIVERRDQVLMTFFDFVPLRLAHLLHEVLVDERTLLD